MFDGLNLCSGFQFGLCFRSRNASGIPESHSVSLLLLGPVQLHWAKWPSVWGDFHWSLSTVQPQYLLDWNKKESGSGANARQTLEAGTKRVERKKRRNNVGWGWFFFCFFYNLTVNEDSLNGSEWCANKRPTQYLYCYHIWLDYLMFIELLIRSCSKNTLKTAKSTIRSVGFRCYLPLIGRTPGRT